MNHDKKNITDTSLKKLGVMRVSTDVYHVGPYKYTTKPMRSLKPSARLIEKLAKNQLGGEQTE